MTYETEKQRRIAMSQYRQYLNRVDSLPEYILNNLSTMPNNKGYIWRGMSCYGKLPAERGQPYILFEKIRGGILRIHEYSTAPANVRWSYIYKVYEKKGKDKRILIKTINK